MAAVVPGQQLLGLRLPAEVKVLGHNADNALVELTGAIPGNSVVITLPLVY